MYSTTIRHIHDVPVKIGPYAQGLLDHLPVVQEKPLIQAPVSSVLWDEVDQLLHGGSIAQKEDEERMLWFLNFRLHGEDRIWWAYFRDFFELFAVNFQICRAFPCLEHQGLESRPHGLRVCSAFYAPTSSRQQRADALQPEAASVRDRQLFPLAPFACDHLTSFIKGLGDAGPCAQCRADTRY